MTEPLRPWTLIERRELLRIEPWLRVSADTVELPDGRRVESYVRLDQPAYATIFAETDDGRVLVFRQYRHGVGRVCLTFPGGHLNDDGESPLDAAKRELLEETGCVAERWFSLGSHVTNANAGGAMAHFFLATGCREVATADSGDLEEMRLLRVAREDVVAAAAAGEFPIVNQQALLAIATHPVLRSAFVDRSESGNVP